jgi:sugar phosphate isomerase/epimerase
VLRAQAAAPKFELGMASYTFRAFALDDTLAMTRRLGLRRISFKSFHLPLEASAEEIRAVLRNVETAGLDLYAGGVIYMKTEAETRQAFDYARAAGMRIIVGVPNHELLPLVDKLVSEYDIRVAVHNHGPTDKIYPTPESAYARIRGLDSRIGLCLDVGHAKRSGIDPAADAMRFANRLLDVHIKDVTAATEKGTTCEMGRGVVDVPAFLRALISAGYSGTVSLEYEKDEKDPLPGAAESIGYLRGVLASL